MSDTETTMVVYTFGDDRPHVDRSTPPAERLRRAAEILRDAASNAAPGADPYPGGWSGFGLVEGGLNRSALYAGPGVDGYRTGVVVEVTEDCDECIPMSQADATYIGLLHPAVGQAVAGLLDEAIQYAESELCRGDWPMLLRALDVADQILGIPAEVALVEHLAAAVTA
jgi:hypothetical protein